MLNEQIGKSIKRFIAFTILGGENFEKTAGTKMEFEIFFFTFRVFPYIFDSPGDFRKRRGSAKHSNYN
jgi:hypothetical protein